MHGGSVGASSPPPRLTRTHTRMCRNLDGMLPAQCTLSRTSVPVTSRCHQFALYLDVLGTPRRFFFEQLSLFARDPEEAARLLEMSTSEGADLFYNYCLREHRTYVEVLEVRATQQGAWRCVVRGARCLTPALRRWRPYRTSRVLKCLWTCCLSSFPHCSRGRSR